MSMAMEGVKSLGLGSNAGGSSPPSVSGAAISSCHVINTPHLDMTCQPAREGAREKVSAQVVCRGWGAARQPSAQPQPSGKPGEQGLGRSREPSLAQPHPSGSKGTAVPYSKGTHRSGGAERREIRLVLDAGPAEVCRDRAGADRVDADAARRIIHSYLPGEAEDPCPRTNFS